MNLVYKSVLLPGLDSPGSIPPYRVDDSWHVNRPGHLVLPDAEVEGYQGPGASGAGAAVHDDGARGVPLQGSGLQEDGDETGSVRGDAVRRPEVPDVPDLPERVLLDVLGGREGGRSRKVAEGRGSDQSCSTYYKGYYITYLEVKRRDSVLLFGFALLKRHLVVPVEPVTVAHLQRGYVLAALLRAVLHEVRQHYYHPALLLPDHAPEVRDGGLGRRLAGDVKLAHVLRAPHVARVYVLGEGVVVEPEQRDPRLRQRYHVRVAVLQLGARGQLVHLGGDLGDAGELLLDGRGLRAEGLEPGKVQRARRDGALK
jgi:hypothetical protein